jgi:hypothetical protein
VSGQNRVHADAVLADLRDPSKQGQTRTCAVRDYIDANADGRSGAAVRAAFIEAVNDATIPARTITSRRWYVSGQQQLIMSSDITDHRNRVCSCFRDPALPPPPNRIDRMEDRIGALEELRAELDRIKTGLLAASVGLRFASDTAPADDNEEEA